MVSSPGPREGRPRRAELVADRDEYPPPFLRLGLRQIPSAVEIGKLVIVVLVVWWELMHEERYHARIEEEVILPRWPVVVFARALLLGRGAVLQSCHLEVDARIVQPCDVGVQQGQVGGVDECIVEVDNESIRHGS